MEHKAQKKIAVFFTHGVSLELWEKRGMFSREIKFYEALAHEVGEISFFTYGRHDDRYSSQLDPHIRIFPKRLPVPNLLYGILLPFLHWRELSRVHLIRIHQGAGAIPALIAHWVWNKPLIVRAGFQWYLFASGQHASHAKLWLISLIEQLTYRSAQFIIHTTQQDADFVVKRYQIDVNKLHVIPNWVDTDLFKPLNIEKQPRSVCFVGRFEEQKNVQVLIAAMKDTEGTLILYGDGSLKRKLEELAPALHVNAQFRGPIANEELPAALNACEIFVLPSLYEGNPKVLLEAMACGLPVIGTNVAGIREVIHDNENGILCEPHQESIHQALQTLLNDRASHQRLGSAARKTILAHASLLNTVQLEGTLLDSTQV